MKNLIKPSLILSATLLLLSISSTAQTTWTTTAGNILTPPASLPSNPVEWLGSANAADLIFKTNSNERLRITSTGSVGIGNSSPQYLLDVKNPATSTTEYPLNITVADAVNDYLRVQNGTGGVNNFYPLITGYKASSTVYTPALGILGSVPTVMDYSPIGFDPGQPIVSFSARRDLGGTGSPILNRPLFAWVNYTTQYMTMLANGNVGIGTSLLMPSNKLSVLTAAINDGLQVMQTGPTSAGLHLDNLGTNGHNWGIFSTGAGNSEGAGNFSIFDYGAAGSGGTGTKFFISGNSTGNVGIGTIVPTAKLTVNGNVLIGDVSTNLPAGYKLYVQSGILTEKLKVAIVNSSSWADYVFEKNYKMLNIKELEEFVKINKHLPNIPSATEMVKEGLDVATMDAKLLEKIEELSLYIIQQNKRIDLLERKINETKTEN